MIHLLRGEHNHARSLDTYQFGNTHFSFVACPWLAEKGATAGNPAR
jgi:hypothetical protein